MVHLVVVPCSHFFSIPADEFSKVTIHFLCIFLKKDICSLFTISKVISYYSHIALLNLALERLISKEAIKAILAPAVKTLLLHIFPQVTWWQPFL